MNVEHTEFRPISRLLTMLILVVVGLAFLSYAMGWVTVESQPDKTTIEIDAKEMKQAADKAVDSAKETAGRVGRAASDAAQEFGEEVSQSPSTQSPDVEDVHSAQSEAKETDARDPTTPPDEQTSN